MSDRITVLNLILFSFQGTMALLSAAHKKRIYCPEQPGPFPVKLTDDTNLSAEEAYEAIKEALAAPGSGSALDLGAGAGYSTKVLHELGYTSSIDAVDPSGDAWTLCGYASDIDGVTFHEQTDEAFLQAHPERQYDAINIAYGIGTAKAEGIGAGHLKANGRMLAPIDDGHCMATYQKSASGSLELLSEQCGWGWQQNVTSLHASNKLARAAAAKAQMTASKKV